MFGKRNRDEAGVTLVATNCELVGDIHFNDQLLINGVCLLYTSPSPRD